MIAQSMIVKTNILYIMQLFNEKVLGAVHGKVEAVNLLVR
jgi:hypothetical protein